MIVAMGTDSLLRSPMCVLDSCYLEVKIPPGGAGSGAPVRRSAKSTTMKPNDGRDDPGRGGSDGDAGVVGDVGLRGIDSTVGVRGRLLVNRRTGVTGSAHFVLAA